MAISWIIGLGNPGRQYEQTRHNVGFMVLDQLAATNGATFQSMPKWQSHLAKLPNDGPWLMKPQTFMNLSGRAIQSVLHFYRCPPSEILIIYDDAALPLGKLRFREKGSAGGHNGIKSILQHLSTDAFPRLKVGIGGSDAGEMVDHVLGKFSTHEMPLVENTLARACQAVQLSLSHGIAAAAARFHTSNQTPPFASDES
ncbi:MAG: aminoacyl-tRNA hydrolase [Verrucomicrobia bacterium]|nr:MAG: aminoacyl-tRNA hydrolase [Verrucomicrobiota bacterium]